MKTSIKANIKQIYKHYAEEFDAQIASLQIYNATYDYLLGQIRDNASILDLACGPGNVSKYLKDRKPGVAIAGVDISEEMIEIAKKRIPSGTFIVNDICDVTFEEKFDCIICAFAIPYLSLNDTSDVLGIISQYLIRDGFFYLSFIEGEKQGFERQSFTGSDELFMYYHPEKSILEMMAQHALSVIKKFDIDYVEQDQSITHEIVYIGARSN